MTEITTPVEASGFLCGPEPPGSDISQSHRRRFSVVGVSGARCGCYPDGDTVRHHQLFWRLVYLCLSHFYDHESGASTAPLDRQDPLGKQ